MRAAALALVTFTAAAAASRVTVVNNCGDLPIHIARASEKEAPEKKKKLGSDEFVTVVEEGVHEIRLTGDESPTSPDPQLTLVYGIKNDKVAYDLYTVFGSPAANAVVEPASKKDDPKDANCKRVVVERGEPTDIGSLCDKDTDLKFTICPEKGDSEKPADPSKPEDPQMSIQ